MNICLKYGRIVFFTNNQEPSQIIIAGHTKNVVGKARLRLMCPLDGYVKSFYSTSSSDESTNENEEDGRPRIDYDKNEGASYSRKHQKENRRTYEHRRQSMENDRDTSQSSNNEQISVPSTFYERLNLDPNANANDIKSSYYSLSKVHHPDIAGENNAESIEKFRLLTEAYTVLSDPDTRGEYDRSLKAKWDWKSSTYTGVSTSRKRSNDFDGDLKRASEEAISRLRRQTAFERDKAANPKKYRAGGFRGRELRDLDRSIDYGKLYYNLANHAKNQHNLDPSNFYSQHFWESQSRRFVDHNMMKKHLSESSSNHDEPLTAVALIVALVLFGIVSITRFDPGYWLDSKLSLNSSVSSKIDEKDESNGTN